MISQEATLPLPSTTIIERLRRLRTLQRRLATQAQPVVLLVFRLLFGSALMLTGWSKLANLDRVVGFFTSLGIPMAQINAPVVAGLELVGGTLLVLGLFTRVISAPLVVVLTVALSSAHAQELGALLSDPGTFIGAAPVPFLAVLLALVSFGPGKLSADHLLASRFLADERSTD